jgi:hypothetical protein
MLLPLLTTVFSFAAAGMFGRWRRRARRPRPQPAEA